MTAAKKAAPAKKAASAKRGGGDSYVVSAPLIQVQIGAQVLQYSFGDLLPDGVDEDNLKHLLENELVRKGSEVVAEPDASADDGDDE